MKVTIRDAQYKVYWHYFKNGKPLVLGERVMRCSVGDNPPTACIIQRTWASGATEHYYSIIYKHVNDTPNRDLARKISLKYVLRDLKFIRADRTIFWKAYLQMTHVIPTPGQEIIITHKQTPK